MIIINFDLKNNFSIAKVVKETSFFRLLTMLKSSIDHPVPELKLGTGEYVI
jgi:hypothetical protein